MLRQPFSNLLKPFCDEHYQLLLWMEIKKAYSHKSRYYHNLSHLEHLFSLDMDRICKTDHFYTAMEKQARPI